MWNSAAKGRIEDVKKALESGQDVDRRDADGRTALMHAAEHGQIDVVKLLIQHGADVNLSLQPMAVEDSDECDDDDDADGDGSDDDDGEQAADGHGCALFDACRSGAEPAVIGQIVECLLQAGATVDVRDEDGCTPLMLCIGSEYQAIVGQLIAAGADVNLVDQAGMAALHHALQVDEDRAAVQAIVGELMDAQADIQRPDDEGQTPLMLAAANAYVEIVQLLLQRGAAIDPLDSEGRSALTRAAESLANLTDDHRASSFDLDEQRAALQELGIDAGAFESYLNKPAGEPDELTLMMSGADSIDEFKETRNQGVAWLNQIIDVLVEQGCPPGNAAASLVKAGRLDILESADDIDLNATDPLGQTALTEAVDRGNVDRVKKLLEIGADPNAPNYFDESPLMAVKNSRRGFECARLLVEAGADLNYKAENGVSLLECTINMGDFEKIEFLLTLGSDATFGSPLLWAARRDDPKVVQLLLKHQADPNTGLDVDGQSSFAGFIQGTTPLMVAAANGNETIVSLLIEAGADVAATDREGKSAIDLAMRHGKLAVAARLRQIVQADASEHEFTAALLPSVEQGDVQQVRECLAHGASANIQSEDGMTPLILAAREGRDEIVDLLLEAGANVNARSADGYGGNQTPLRCAVVRNHTLIVRKLLDAGADPSPVYAYSSIPTEKHNTVTMSGGSALHDAARGGNDEVVAMLLDAGADPNAVDASDETPLVSAVRSRNWATAKLLLQRGAVRRQQNQDYLAMLDFADAAQTKDFAVSVKQVEDLCGTQAEAAEQIPGMMILSVLADGEPPPSGTNAEDYAGKFAFERELDQKKWNIIDAAYDACLGRGHLLINSGLPFLGGPKRYLYLVPTDDKYAVLASIGVRGNEVELNTNDIIGWMREFEKTHPWRLIGCRFDILEFDLLELPANVESTARRLYEFCPDVIEQGFESMGALIADLESNRRVHLWWD